MSAGAKLGKVGLAPVTEIVDTPVRPLAPIRINLLPHREMDRERRKKDFISLAGLVGIAGAVAVFAGGFAINQQIASQQERNAFITTENARLDAEIAEVKTVMVQNIERVLERGEKIELLVDKTENLNAQAFRFKKQSTTLRRAMWWKNARLVLALSGALVALALFVAMSACGLRFQKCRHNGGSAPPPP
jgi:uncharacterized protein HemX